jgi:carboxymethylenebutenolidase
LDYEQVSILTHDGECPAYVFTPLETTRHPAVIFYMDGLGIRPAIFEMGQRLAGHGYVVLVPDLYYRFGRYEALDPKVVFASGDVRGNFTSSPRPTIVEPVKTQRRSSPTSTVATMSPEPR